MPQPISLSRRSALSALLSLPLLGLAAEPQPAARAARQADPPPAGPAKPITPPLPVREFRGVWVATVENIDWPSKPGLTTAQQQAEFLLLLDRTVQLNLNAVLLQVRPACDALYQSDLEPWSEYLTGTMGKAPEPFYDPLTFAVTEAHKRGLELHAWINPFRARQKGSAAKAPTSANHISHTHPDWVREYGALEWLDPGEKDARDHSLAVVNDIVRRYDVDGVHVDDYFYPYKETDAAGKVIDFPDDTTFTKYQSGGGTLSRSDWRRSNIDYFIEQMYKQTKAIKPWVKVGISPFGIWRPGYPAQIKGFDSYEQLYGDSRRWLREGWADYFSPQLYWRIEQTPQSFPVLLSWWIGENVQGRHIWPGQYTSLAARHGSKWPQEEIEYQIRTTRGLSGTDSGTVHFSAEFLLAGDTLTDGSLSKRLVTTVYGDPTLVPASPWLGAATDNLPAAPDSLETTVSADPALPGWNVRWPAPASPAAAPWLWVVQWRAGGETWHQTVLAGASGATKAFVPAPPPAPLPAGGRRGRRGAAADRPKPIPAVVAVTAIDRIGRAGVPTVTQLPALPPPPGPPEPPSL